MLEFPDVVEDMENQEMLIVGITIYTERKKKRIFTLVVICIKDVLIV